MKKDLESIKKEVLKFLTKYKYKKNVIGAILCGSFVTGNPTKYSDVDLHIFFDDSVDFRHRGNHRTKDLIIDYFSHPKKRLQKYLDNDQELRSKYTAHSIGTGLIIKDTDGEIKKIQKWMRKELKRPFPKLSKDQIKRSLYFIEDSYKNLEEVVYKQEFYYVYYNYLTMIHDVYSKFMRTEKGAAHKHIRFLIDKKDQEKYKIITNKDKAFVKLFVNAVNVGSKKLMMKNMTALKNYIVKKMGGISLERFNLKEDL